MLVKLVEHFTDTPGGRYISDGPYSGELFRKQFMEPFFEEKKYLYTDLILYLDGAYGLPTGFISEVFDVLVTKYSLEVVKNSIEILLSDNPTAKKQIQEILKQS